jgi:hypothetical protein
VALENVKNKILATLESASGLEDSTKRVWQGDAKEMFYRALAVHELLVRDPRAARGFLVAAESAFGQVASELRALGENAEPLGHGIGRGLQQMSGSFCGLRCEPR